MKDGLWSLQKMGKATTKKWMVTTDDNRGFLPWAATLLRDLCLFVGETYPPLDAYTNLKFLQSQSPREYE